MKPKRQKKQPRATTPAIEGAPKLARIPSSVEAAQKELDYALSHYHELWPHIKDRRLSGREGLIATEAWLHCKNAGDRLREAAQAAQIDIAAPPLPEAPRCAVVPKRISPFTLAALAALLSGNDPSKAKEKLPEARELLIEAAGYLQDCMTEGICEFMNGISFDKILSSNDKNQSSLSKLLPGITTQKGLEKLIRRYYATQCLPFTADDLVLLTPA